MAFGGFGTWVQNITQDWLVLTLTHSAQAVGLTAAFQFLPALLLGPFGGAVADRIPRKRVLMCTQTLNCLLACCTAVIVLIGHAQAWEIFLLAVVAGLIWVVDNPTRQALISDLVPADVLRSAVAVNSSIFQSARVMAPALAGVLITTTGCGFAFCVDTAFFAVAVLAWSRLRPGQAVPRGARTIRGVGAEPDGGVLRYLRQEPRIAVTLLLVGVVGTFGLNFPVVLTVIAQDDFHGTADLYGVFNVMIAMGSIAGALVIAGRARARLVQIIALSAAFGAVQLTTAFMSNLLAFLVFLIALGFSNLAFQTVANSAVQLWTAPRIRGRVLGVYGQLFVGGTPIGAPLIGALTARCGGRVGMAVCGAVPLLAAALLGTTFVARRGRGGKERVWRPADDVEDLPAPEAGDVPEPAQRLHAGGRTDRRRPARPGPARPGELARCQSRHGNVESGDGAGIRPADGRGA
jgi:MFS family permease